MDQSQKQIADLLNSKAGAIEALFSQPEAPVKVTRQGPGEYAISKTGVPLNLSDDQIKGLEIYLSLLSLFKPEEISGKAEQ